MTLKEFFISVFTEPLMVGFFGLLIVFMILGGIAMLIKSFSLEGEPWHRLVAVVLILVSFAFCCGVLILMRVPCPNCGNKVDTEYCSDCGARVRAYITSCDECGWEIGIDDKFCGNCGAEIITETSVEQ